MTADTWLALIAIVISLFSIVLQYWIDGPKIDVLNDKDTQRSVVREYPGLPENIRSNFPRYTDAEQGYALIKMVFGNSGDRAGLVTIQKIEFTKGLASKLVETSYYSYTLVPAYDIVEKKFY